MNNKLMRMNNKSTMNRSLLKITIKNHSKKTKKVKSRADNHPISNNHLSNRHHNNWRPKTTL